jgi:hypothetical protein
MKSAEDKLNASLKKIRSIFMKVKLEFFRCLWPRGPRRRSWPLGCCDHGFESRWGMDICLCVCMLCCPVEVEAFVMG